MSLSGYARSGYAAWFFIRDDITQDQQRRTRSAFRPPPHRGSRVAPWRIHRGGTKMIHQYLSKVQSWWRPRLRALFDAYDHRPRTVELFEVDLLETSLVQPLPALRASKGGALPQHQVHR